MMSLQDTSGGEPRYSKSTEDALARRAAAEHTDLTAPEKPCVVRFYHNHWHGDAPEMVLLTLAELVAEWAFDPEGLASMVEELQEAGSRDYSDHKSVSVYSLLDDVELAARWNAHLGKTAA
jgi:hypothetical protein